MPRPRSVAALRPGSSWRRYDHADHDECQFLEILQPRSREARAWLNGHAFPASLDHVEPNQSDSKFRSVLLEPVSSSGVQMALVGDRRRGHGHLDVQRSGGLADDESQSECVAGIAGSGRQQLANVSVRASGRCVGGHHEQAPLRPGA